MELNKIPGYIIAFVLIGILVGVGIILFDNLAYSTYYTSTTNDTVNAYLTNGSNTLSLATGNITSITGVYNTSGGLIPSTYYSFIENTTNGNQLYFQALAEYNKSMTTQVYIIYSYENYNTEANTASKSIATTISAIPNTWLALIITIVVLGLLIGIVIKSFGGGGFKR